MSVHKKLMQARVALQGMQLKKSGHNKFAGYEYFELGDFLPQVQTIFNDLGLCGVISFSADIATLAIVDTDDGQSIVITSPMAEAALKGCHPIQNLGAAETYERRYLWITAMEIVEHDALDATTGQEGKGKGRITPTDGAIEALDEANQQAAKEDAEAIVKMWNSGEKQIAWETYMTLLEGDHEYMLAVWAFMKDSSAVRSGLKKMKQEKDNG